MVPKRIIGQLRACIPGKWTWAYPHWKHESGFYVYACAARASHTPWDEDSFETQFRRSDTLEQVHALPRYSL